MGVSEGLIESRAGVATALAEALLKAATQGGRELCWMAPDLADWPLSDPALLDALHAWALPHRRLHLLSQGYEAVRRKHPRFVQWRVTHDHVISARSFQPDDLKAAGEDLPGGMLLAPGLLLLKLWTPERAWLSCQAADLLYAREAFDAIAQRSCDSFSASTLGL
ncbi:hypothetical protein LZ017_20740 [Pelomonas sp. CA6]|uniref:hypothetical protein n=1 Tax=Pelomonas sp. CA6 TaxID=2907999 RepID=UPI001F4C4257|nr:hypothetical protein [Pelomonas sp. CA6]MCH7345808.1 hypothetical protein [Pelomonas sp. CA6]